MVVFIGTSCSVLSLQIVLGDAGMAGTLSMSHGLWQRAVAVLGGKTAGGRVLVETDFATLFLAGLAFALICWLLGAAVICRRSGRPFLQCLTDWGISGWTWWLVPGLWVGLWSMTLFTAAEGFQQFVLGAVPLFYTVTLAGWSASFLNLAGRHSTAQKPLAVGQNDDHVSGRVWLAMSLFAVVFITMNWQLYHGLLIPHGDSAMYEEHLWNVTHGKGFRSDLDRGLFLGEHIQVIHLLLVPLHLFWPSQLLLELCESVTLASGAIAVFWLARRHTGSVNAAGLLACAYLFYFPLQFLDISIDLKTFRPISFGVPLMLFAIDQMERRRYRSMLVLLLLALSAKEDYAVIIAVLGVWMALFQGRETDASHSDARSRWWGAALAVFGVLYLLAAIKLVIPAFREGDVHYARYFGELGSSPGDIVHSILTQPALVFVKLFSGRSLTYLLLMLLPAGFLPLLSPFRLAVGAPLFGVLCLLELTNDPANAGTVILIPIHHFHAPLIPVVFWAAAAGLGAVGDTWGCCRDGLPIVKRLVGKAERPAAETAANWAAHFVWTSALAASLFFSISPLGIAFWDSGSRWYWRSLYVPGQRAKLFPRVVELIPPEARVASTDFVHPRFTHHKRSYDYSNYPRAVNDNKPGAPLDTDYIVIDTRHPYSEIRRPKDVRELREQSDHWELLLDDGYFIVLKHKHRTVP